MAFGDLVQTAKATGNEATTAAGITATFGATPTPGNLITVHAYAVLASTSITTDLASALNLAAVAGDGGGVLDGFYKIAGASEATAIKVFPAATSDISVVICEWEGPFAASPLDAESGGLSSATTSVTSQSTGTTPTTAQADELAVAAISVFLHLTDIASYTNSFTEANEQQGPATSNRATIAVARRVLSATGTYSTTASFSSARAKGMISTFKRAVTGNTGTIASTLGAVTLAASGSTLGGTIGTIASTLGSVGLAASGTVVNPSWPGGLPQAAVIALYDARSLAGSAGAAVAAWPDEGPLDQADLAMATGTQQPVISDSGFGGARSVQFDGSNDRMDMALAASYTDDFALILVCELLTYPTGAAAVFYSTGAIPNKNILGIDDVEDPPGWVTMSSNDGTQAQHHHGTADWSYVEAVPSRFIMTQLVRNDGEHKLWENASLVINLTDSSGENSDLNNLVGIKIGAREDNSRFVNGRIAYLLMVDMTETDEATLLAARDEIAPEFAVPGFASSTSGTIASTLGQVTLAASGQYRQVESGGSTAITEVDESGGGRKTALGGSTTSVGVDDQGGGRKTGKAGSTTIVGVDDQGAGRKTVSGGASTIVGVDDQGAGRKTGQGGATTIVGADDQGDGRKTGKGGAGAVVNVVATGSGGSFDNPTGGSTATVGVDDQGAGRKTTGGGATTIVGVDDQGGGRKGARAGATSLVAVDDQGGGHKVGKSGSTALVAALATGAGFGAENPAGGATASVTVQATGGGVAVANPKGGNTTIVPVVPTGDGVATRAGGSTAIVTVQPQGAGSTPNGLVATSRVRELGAASTVNAGLRAESRVSV